MSTLPLKLLNFFLADVKDGLGPFLGVFLQSKDWDVDHIGYVMTIGGISGMIFTTPFGILADVIKSKRAIIAFSAIIIVIACSINYFYPTFITTAAAQVLTAIAAALIPPAISAITLGLVGVRLFDYQLGQNQSYNHAGTAIAAVAAGLLSFYYGLAAVFALMGLWTVLSIITLTYIRPEQIDYKAARGLKKNEKKPEPLGKLLRNKTLLMLGLTVALFHLSNAAMLPLLGQSMVAIGETQSPGMYTAITIVVAQLTMIPMALLAGKFATKKGYDLLFIVALSALPIRGLIAALFPHYYIVFPVQILDGIGAGLMGVAVPGLVARILDGSGRFNAGLGIIMTIQGIGASLSPSLAGIIAKSYNYSYAFLGLSLVAIVGLVVWIIVKPMMSKYYQLSK